MKSAFFTLIFLCATVNSATISYKDAVSVVQSCLIGGEATQDSFFEMLQFNLTGKNLSFESNYPFDVYQDQVRDFKRILYRGKASDATGLSAFEGFTTGSTKLHFLFIDRSADPEKTTYMETEKKFPIINFKKISSQSYDLFGNIVDARLEGAFIDSASQNELNVVSSETKIVIRNFKGEPLSVNTVPYIQCLRKKLNLL